MQFRVPQFIDVEDKIFGPFSFKQFIYLLGGGGIAFVLYKVLPSYISFIFILPVIGIAAALAFYQVNGKPFIFTLEASIKYFLQSKLYIWKKAPPVKQTTQQESPSQNTSTSVLPTLTDSKLKDISWSLDVLDTNRK